MKRLSRITDILLVVALTASLVACAKAGAGKGTDGSTTDISIGDQSGKENRSIAAFKVVV